MDCGLDHSVIGLIDPAHVPFVHQSWFFRNSLYSGADKTDNARFKHSHRRAPCRRCMGFDVTCLCPRQESTADEVNSVNDDDGEEEEESSDEAPLCAAASRSGPLRRVASGEAALIEY